MSHDVATVQVHSGPDHGIVRIGDDHQVVAVTVGPDRAVVVGLATVGPQGPPGPAGENGGYTHTQVTPSLVWTVQHGLGYRPGGIDTGDVEGVVTHVSDAVLLITFLEPTAGLAHVS